jgi:hypothetical protein
MNTPVEYDDELIELLKPYFVILILRAFIALSLTPFSIPFQFRN